MANIGIAALSGLGGLMQGFSGGMARLARGQEQRRYEQRIAEQVERQKKADRRREEQFQFSQEQNLANTMRDMRGRIGMAKTLTGTGLMGDNITARQLSKMPMAQQSSLFNAMREPSFKEKEKIKHSYAKALKNIETGKGGGLNKQQEKALASYQSFKKQALSISAGVGIAAEALTPEKIAASKEAARIAEEIKKHAVTVLGMDPGLFGEKPGTVSVKDVDQDIDFSSMTDDELNAYLGLK